jgi:hypothetical protein
MLPSRYSLPTGKSAIQQVWKPALRSLGLPGDLGGSFLRQQPPLAATLAPVLFGAVSADRKV